MTCGVHTITAEEYHADPCDQPSLSSSIARLLVASSPAHARAAHPKLNPGLVREEKHHFDVGEIAHALLLQGLEIVEIVDADNWRTNAAKEARDDARAHGRVPLLTKDMGAVTAMLDATRPQLEAIDADPPLFTDGKPERTLVWQDNGVTCRARLDWLRDDLRTIDDYKTAANANPERWSRSLFDHGCDIQAAFYLRGLKAVTGADAEFRFVVQEKAAPYALSVVSLSPAALALAHDKVEYAIRLWRDCLASNRWPAYPTRVCYAELPAWEEARWLDRETREEMVA